MKGVEFMPASQKELEQIQNERLFDLLKIKKANGDKENLVLEDAINRAMASMTEEQIAWVEKLVNRSR